MTTSDELEQWNLRSLENLLGATTQANQSLKRLGDTLNHTKVDLSHWGGEAADAWRALHGHARADIDAQGIQSEAVGKRLEKLYPDVRSVRSDYENLRDELSKNRFVIAPPGTVKTSVDSPSFDAAPLQWITYMQESQTKLDAILARATAVSAEMADAMYAACGTAAPPDAPAPPKPQDQPQPDGTTTPADQLPLPTKNGKTPFPTEATKDNGPDVSHNLKDNPHPSPLLAGLSADQWRERLAHFQPGDPLPDPRTPTGDKNIDAIANAAGQQNTSYAWGGNKSKDGPSVGQGDNGDGANQYHDWDRTGYDCGGLVRYSINQGAGVDVGMGTNAIDTNPKLAHVAGGVPGSLIGQNAKPGDILIFGTNPGGPFSGSNTHHTGLYIGNGFMINAPESGKPIQVDSLRAFRGETTDILRAAP